MTIPVVGFPTGTFGLQRAWPESKPSVNFGDFEGLNNDNTDNEVGTSLSWMDNLTLQRGRNTFKAGIEVRRVLVAEAVQDRLR